MEELKTAQEELHDKLHEERKYCKARNNNSLWNGVIVLALIAMIVNSFVAYDTYGSQKDTSWSCIEWQRSGISYWRDECRYHHANNESCQWYMDEDKTNDFVSMTYDSNKTLINETRQPCTKYIYIKSPLGKTSINNVR